MFKESLKRLVNETKNVEDISKILFSDSNSCREEYNLSYLGEVLERFEERGFTIDDVLQGIIFGFSKNDNFVDASINTNQLILFKAKFEELCNTNYNPYSHIGFIFLLLNVENENYETEVLKFLSINNLNEAFLLLVEAFKYGFLPLNDNIKKAIIIKLQEEKFTVDFVSLLDFVSSNYSSYHSVYSNIRDIIKIFGFKSKDFNNKEVFKVLDSYKKLGSNRMNQSDTINMLKCFSESEDIFWLLNLKIARETLSSEGSAIDTANSNFKSYISKSIDISKPNFELFSKLQDVSFKYVDFTNLEENRFSKLIYLLQKGSISISDLGKSIYTKNTFVEQLKISLENLVITEGLFVRICLNIIKDADEITWKEFFFNLIKEKNCSLDYSDYGILHEEGLLEFKDCLGKNVVKFLESLYQSSTYSDEKLATNILLAFKDGYIDSEKIYEESLSRSDGRRYFYSRISIVDFVYNNIFSYIDSICETNRELSIELIQVLETFLFSTSNVRDKFETNNYIKLIIKSLDNDFYLEALELTKDDVKEIAKTLLSFDSISNAGTLHFLNKYAFSEREANLLKLEEKFVDVKRHILERYLDVSVSRLNKFFTEAEELGVKNHYSDLICELLETTHSLEMGKYCEVIVNLYSLDIISKEKRDAFIMKKIDLMCVRAKESISIKE